MAAESQSSSLTTPPEVGVRRIHRRGPNRAWDLLKLCFRDVNRETLSDSPPPAKGKKE